MYDFSLDKMCCTLTTFQPILVTLIPHHNTINVMVQYNVINILIDRIYLTFYFPESDIDIFAGLKPRWDSRLELLEGSTQITSGVKE